MGHTHILLVVVKNTDIIFLKAIWQRLLKSLKKVHIGLPWWRSG